MKWREVAVRERFYTGPEEGRVRYVARKGGVSWEVRAYWMDPFKRSGTVVWMSYDGRGNNERHLTKNAAIARCEREAGVTPS